MNPLWPCRCLGIAAPLPCRHCWARSRVEIGPMTTAIDIHFHAVPRRLADALRRREFNAAAVSLPPELFLNWTSPELGERLARTINDGFAEMARAYPDRFLPLAA